jgi:hypothetical protein
MTMTRELYWVIWTLLTSIILTGLFFGFNFVDNAEVQLHDTYIIVLPVYFSLALWIILTFIIFLIVGIRNRFVRIAGTWILLVTNSIIAVLMMLLTYRVYAFFIVDILFDVFRETSRIDAIWGRFNLFISTCLLLTILFLVGEFLLIRRLVKLKRME